MAIIRTYTSYIQHFSMQSMRNWKTVFHGKLCREKTRYSGLPKICMRGLAWALTLTVFLISETPDAWAQQNTDAFLKRFWAVAGKAGVRREIFNEALSGFTPDPKIIAHTHKQSEFVRPIWMYIDDALSKGRLQRGKSVAQKWQKTFDGVEKKYKVPRSAILGIWGMESNFGSFSGKTPTIRALATLAYERYRDDFFWHQLVDALLIIQSDNLDPAMMVGSWAGAMGQVQFMPSSFRKYAVDYDGDGIKNIWSSVPDSLASAANYLHQHGWNSALPWGFEVQLPDGFDFRNYRHDFSVWSKMGLRRINGKPLPKKGEARIFAPAGVQGPIFLLTENFDVIKTYNFSDSYALGVLLLGDQLVGRPVLVRHWPRSEKQLDHKERIELQKRLHDLGLYDDKFDGRHGTKTRDAVRQFQLKFGYVADGYPNEGILQALRKARQ